jgi:hypothetical protein
VTAQIRLTNITVKKNFRIYYTFPGVFYKQRTWRIFSRPQQVVIWQTKCTFSYIFIQLVVKNAAREHTYKVIHKFVDFVDFMQVPAACLSEGWPLLTVETQMNGDSKSTNKRCPSLVASLGLPCRYKRFLFFLGCSSRHTTIYIFSSPNIMSIILSPSPSKLGRNPCWVACLLECVSGVYTRSSLVYTFIFS